jgi:hypothetical protein
MSLENLLGFFNANRPRHIDQKLQATPKAVKNLTRQQRCLVLRLNLDREKNRQYGPPAFQRISAVSG